MAFGIMASLLFAQGNGMANTMACFMFFLAYVMDHCDGEIARAKHQETSYGDKLDTFSDWIVHATFFIGIGYGTYTQSGEILWAWLGAIASAGASINHILLYLGNKHTTNNTQKKNLPPETCLPPGDWVEKIIFIFLELTRADFWLIVCMATLFNIDWCLIIASALGAHAYWITQCYFQSDYHV